MAYVLGDIIEAVHFNGFSDLAADVYGIGDGDLGYGQHVAPNPSPFPLINVPIGKTVESEEWSDLVNAISVCGVHQGTVTNPDPFSNLLPEVAVGEIIEAHEPNVVEALFDVSGEDTNPTSIAWNNNGTKLYMVGATTDTIYQYPVSTPFNVATAGAAESSFFVGGEDADPRGMAWNNDGTKIYMIGLSSDSIHQYPVSTPFNVATAGLVEASFSVSGEDANPRGMAWNNDGTKVYMVGNNTTTIYQYPVSTPFDIATAGVVEASFLVSGEDTSPRGMAWNNDGTKIYMIGTSSDTIYQYPVSTPFDIATAGVVEASFSVSGEDTFTNGMAWNDDGTKLYMVGATTDTIYQYPVSTPFDISTAGSVTVADIPGAITLITTNSLNYDAGSVTVFANQLNSSRGAAWSTSIEHRFTAIFPAADPARYFFNSGGEIRFRGSRSGGSATPQNTSWTNLLAALGTVIMDAHSTTTTGSSTTIASGVGYYELTTSFQNILTLVSSGAYASNQVIIQARTMDPVPVGANNDNGRRLEFRMIYSDGHTNGFFDVVDGTITSDIDLQRATSPLFIDPPALATVIPLTSGS